MLAPFLPALRMLVLLSVLTGVAYPFLVTGIAQLAFPGAAGASSTCPWPAGREAPGPRRRQVFFELRLQTSIGIASGTRRRPRTISFARSARQALTRRCSVRNCPLLA